MLQVINKARAKSLIISKSHDFRRAATQLFNHVAFHAEKLAAESIPAAESLFENDREIINILIDGTGSPGDRLLLATETLTKMVSSRECVILAYVNDKSRFVGLGDLERDFCNLTVASLPFTKEVFIEVFHNRKPTTRRTKSSKQVSTVNFFEATAHVRETIDMLNALKGDNKNIDAILRIGQRFNGMMGTYQFFGDMAGFAELRDLATIIDTIARTYEKRRADLKVIAQEHFDLLYAATRCAFLVLKELRDGQPVSIGSKEQHQRLNETFNGMEDLIRPEKKSQDEVDALLADLDAS